jgi:hypothetical protein
MVMSLIVLVVKKKLEKILVEVLGSATRSCVTD